MKIRIAINVELDRLDQLLQKLVEQLPREKVMDAFSGEAKSLVEEASAAQQAYVQERIHDMLLAAGVVIDDPLTG